MEQLKSTVKMWTIQKKSIIDEVMKTGIYEPDFKKSDYVAENEELEKLYSFLLACYNGVNGTDCNGLIFTFMKMIDDTVHFFKDYDDFKGFICQNSGMIQSYWEKEAQKDNVIVELEIESNLNPLLIDINNWQLLMPPIMVLPPYTEDDVEMITDWLRNGTFGRGYYNPAIMQAHIPCIKKENIIGIYDMFNI